MNKPSKQTLKKRYITSDDFIALSSEQNEQCAICKVSFHVRKAFIDHDHATGYIRGLLCSNCNSGLGMFKDKISNLSEAIKYLDSPPALELYLISRLGSYQKS